MSGEGGALPTRGLLFGVAEHTDIVERVRYHIALGGVGGSQLRVPQSVAI